MITKPPSDYTPNVISDNSNVVPNVLPNIDLFWIKFSRQKPLNIDILKVQNIFISIF